jgi:phosphoinositide-3-kinase regulatory subunit 4
VHGDIKPDNFLVTSYDWLFLSDIHVYKPVLIDDENLEEYNKFFGHLENNKQCYVAPEKWYSPK